MWADLQEEYAGLIEFVMVDRDTNEGNDFALSHGIRYQPGFVVMDSAGETVYAALGPWEDGDLRALVRSAAP